MRVHELAKELGTTSKVLLDQLHALGADASSHMSKLEDDVVKRLKDSVHKSQAPAKTPDPVPAPPAPVKSAAPVSPPDTDAKSTPAKPEAPAPAGLPPPPGETPISDRDLAGSHPPVIVHTPAGKWELNEEDTEFGPSRRRPQGPRRPHHKPPTRTDRDVGRGPGTPGTEPSAPGGKSIVLRGAVVVKDLAERMGLRPNLLIADLMSMNVFAAINDTIDIKVARQVAEKRGFILDHDKKIEEHRLAQKQRDAEPVEEPDRPEDLVPRPPIVTFMGHVDHGKTSLLDKIRNTKVAAGESGGITQHIGAYTVQTQGSQITFLDTPGHAAFTAMRARGAKLTDIVVIIIAADDGIMPQTKEAISHARAADVALMVAVNKIDLPSANVMSVMRQLQNEGLSPEDWGGQTICCSVSATTGQGIDHLLEMIHLQAEILELKANPKRRANGYVIEAQLEPGMGPTATLMVGSGTLNIGDIILCGRFYGKVKALINDHGLKVKSALPATPVKCLGLSGVPEAGMEFRVCANERVARDLAEQEMQKNRTLQIAAPKKVSLDNLFEHMELGEKVELKVILKADTQGSLEAITHSLQEIKSEKVSLSLIMSNTGNITANDVMLAAASKAVIVGFHVSKEPGVDNMARHEGVDIRMHQIIYAISDEVRDAMTGLLAPKVEERVRGQAEIRQTFPMGKRGKIAGCMMINGYVTPKLRVRIKRGKEVLHEGHLASLKRFQDDVSQVKEGQECGIRLENFAGFSDGDIMEFYELEQIKQTL